MGAAAHIGRIGTYAELAASEGCAFTAFVNVADHHDVQATWQAAEPRLGTNPFCAARPGLKLLVMEPKLILRPTGWDAAIPIA